MIELRNDKLVFSFPEVHRQARLEIDLQRTLRIPDDDRTYPLPPGLGRFPLRHVDDFAANVPAAWMEHGGVMLPMYQSEALWLRFDTPSITERIYVCYPFAIKVGTGKINAVTGQSWADGLNGKPQDYLVAPPQPWLDGYCVQKGLIRQFVAMPLGAGYSAEEQLTGRAEHGGLQIAVYPMKAAVFERKYPVRPKVLERPFLGHMIAHRMTACSAAGILSDMALSPGGRMRQEIYDDPHALSDWDTEHGSRCFVHLANSLTWRNITGQEPPGTPPTARDYTERGLPWFEYYNESARQREGAPQLAGLQSVAALGKAKGAAPLPENAPATPRNVVEYRVGLAKHQVREGTF